MTLYHRDQRALSKLQKLRFFPLAVTGGDGSLGISVMDCRFDYASSGLAECNREVIVVGYAHRGFYNLG